VLYFIGKGSPAKGLLPLKLNPGVRLSFLPSQNFIAKSTLWVKNRAEHGSGVTKEVLILLSKKDKIILSKTACQDFISN
jgi:hypothetical protein